MCFYWSVQAASLPLLWHCSSHCLLPWGYSAAPLTQPEVRPIFSRMLPCCFRSSLCVHPPLHPVLRGKQLPSWGLSSCRKPPTAELPEPWRLQFRLLSWLGVGPHNTPSHPETLLLGPSDSSRVFPQMTQTPRCPRWFLSKDLTVPHHHGLLDAVTDGMEFLPPDISSVPSWVWRCH